MKVHNIIVKVIKDRNKVEKAIKVGIFKNKIKFQDKKVKV